MKISLVNYTHQNLNTAKPQNKGYFDVSFCGQIAPDVFSKALVDYSQLQKYLGKIQAVFADIDGTISKSNDIVTKKVIGASATLEKRNIPLILSTARTYTDTKTIIDKLGHKPKYSIVLGGAGIVDKDGNYIARSEISKEAGNALVSWFQKTFAYDKNYHLVVYFDDKTYCMSDFRFPWVSDPIEKVDDFSKLFNQSVMQKAILFSDNKSINSPKDIFESLKMQGISDFRVDGNVSGGCEFQSAKVSKQDAITHILKILNLEPNKAMAIGDSGNDIEMLEYIKGNGGLAVAMGNANQSVKQHSNFITDDVVSDGFARVIENLF